MNLHPIFPVVLLLAALTLTNAAAIAPAAVEAAPLNKVESAVSAAADADKAAKSKRGISFFGYGHSAPLVSAPLVSHAYVAPAPVYHAAPYVHHAPLISHAPLLSSSIHVSSVSHHAPLIAHAAPAYHASYHAAPIYSHAPAAYVSHAPLYSHHAPLSYHSSPLLPAYHRR